MSGAALVSLIKGSYWVRWSVKSLLSFMNICVKRKMKSPGKIRWSQCPKISKNIKEHMSSNYFQLCIGWWLLMWLLCIIFMGECGGTSDFWGNQLQKWEKWDNLLGTILSNHRVQEPRNTKASKREQVAVMPAVLECNFECFSISKASMCSSGINQP